MIILGLHPRIAMRLPRRFTLALAFPLALGCADGPAAEEPPAAVSEPPRAPAAPAVAPPVAQPAGSAVTCIRGGTTRAEVRGLMGEPDSISFGVWLYGESHIAFGYGVVVEFENADGRIPTCDGAGAGASGARADGAPPG